MQVNNFPDRVIQGENESYIYFGGTSYLGMSTLPEFQEQLFESLKQWGTSYGSSRNSNIKLQVYSDFENQFSAFVGASSALAVSSGTLAGKLVLDYFSRTYRRIYHYPMSHPAILVKESMPLYNGNSLNPELLSNTAEEIVIVLDAVLSSQVKPTSLEFLNHIPAQKQITLVIDESHSLGIVGNEGRGIFSSIKAPNINRKILVASMAKALGLSAGVIASDKETIDALGQEISFVSSSGANPAYLDTYMKSDRLYAEQRKKLKENLEIFFKGVELPADFKYEKNYPVIYCEQRGVYERLLEENMVIANFKYPNYKEQLSRIVISANHTKSDLSKLKNVLINL
ncbi:aminotransferase class I/II-fold pyridoxal phosphate-dependent enzyme [Formosa sp. S-31]|uniref:aminotransferase class I/II-fold pyridoxal phosphate-dependent enzyme n=1 Tax=Formosa sp. S-31 TaxID=2790949 RepID=UPI003EBC26AD